MTSLAAPRIALGFLTRLPAGDAGPLGAAALSRAALWFPVVGALVGAVLGGVRLAGDAVGLDPGPATALALLAAILVTGGLHEDGFADCADAAGAHTTRARRLEILRDSRVGTFGALAVGFALLVPWSALVTLDGEHVLRAAIVAHVLGRWAMLPLSRLVAPARPDGSGVLLRASTPVLAGATVVAVAAALAAAGTDGAIALAVAVCVAALSGAGARRAFGGTTGDVFGATAKLVELATYVALAACW